MDANIIIINDDDNTKKYCLHCHQTYTWVDDKFGYRYICSSCGQSANVNDIQQENEGVLIPAGLGTPVLGQAKKINKEDEDLPVGATWVY